ncbi:Major facilitator superfamily multidrug transporter mdrA [Penicillium maclennaniae]|uniref:Major facilitator superfamily multidrug transporter mdrA n=1 Tax=Penicillium maclennaniae TaxID=1343394 RepID=UPI0025422BED|nr:Major facilitator superfamily multidrug transporter mdrA [Penicillium maclennaniae]KAJ5662627.1 Major facilitator superfamily multidrug transporter mdrA [Penicillium maclennaniae]
MMTEAPSVEVKAPTNLPRTIPFWRLVTEPGVVTQEVVDHTYAGSGTEEDPYVVQWMPKDFRNPLELGTVMKWSITMVAALETLVVALVSSAYTGGIVQIEEQFLVTTEVATLGVSLYVLGFALGPLIWAPMSEMFGRQKVFIGTYCGLTVFCAATIGAKNIQSLLIFRFLAGAFGSSPFTNSGGVIADMFAARERGLALSAFALAPFLGPVIGPIVGGFLGMEAGWKWVMGLLTILCGIMWFIGAAFKPETYAPVLLRQRALTLSKLTGKLYISKLDLDDGRPALKEALKTSLSRPFILLFCEPIVLLLSIYLAIIYGTLYMLFGAFPIVYELHRGWNQGVSGLAFLGVMVGMLGAIAYSIPENTRYGKLLAKNGGYSPPESRLPPCMLASIALPVGLFWFAWTNSPSVHWMASIAAGVPFGFGMVLVFLSVFNYLIDAYTIFAASVLAANSLLRSLFGFAFPLFTTYMFQNLGIHWAASVPAFLALACVPFPFILYKKGLAIRKYCKYSAQSEAFVQSLLRASAPAAELEVDDSTMSEQAATRVPSRDLTGSEEAALQKESAHEVHSMHRSLSRASTHAAELQRVPTYEANPYNIDRVHTRESFK